MINLSFDIVYKKLLHRLGNAEINNTFYTIVVLARPEVVNDNNLGYIDEPFVLTNDVAQVSHTPA